MPTSIKSSGLLNNRYLHVTDLNHGSYGVVSLVKDTANHDELRAIKCLNKHSSADNSWSLGEEALHEISIHKKLGDHKNIARLLDYFETDNTFYLVMEYYSNGDLYEAIKAQRGPREQGCILEFMNQLLDAIEYCHSKGIYHRDIKPENILIASDGTVKLADWGLATTHKISSEFGVGSERYMAPELLDKANTKEYNAAQADLWATGVVLLNILFGRNPFTVASQKDKLFMDFASSREALFDIFPTLSLDVFSVLRHSLTIDPDNRSLSKMRMDLAKVEEWTTDDYDYIDVEDVDDEKTDMLDSVANAAAVAASAAVGEQNGQDNEVYVTTTNRQPFRTPTAMGSVRQDYLSSWNRTMQFTPPVHNSRLPGHANHGPSSLHFGTFANIEEDGEDGEESYSDDFDYGDDHDEMFAMDPEHSGLHSRTRASPVTPLEQKFANMNVNGRADSDSSIGSVPSLVQSHAPISSVGLVAEGSMLSKAQPVATSSRLGLPAAGILPQSAPDNGVWKFNNKSWGDFEFDDEDEDVENDEFYQMLAASLPSSAQTTSAGTSQTNLSTGSKAEPSVAKKQPVHVQVAGSSPLGGKMKRPWVIGRWDGQAQNSVC